MFNLWYYKGIPKKRYYLSMIKKIKKYFRKEIELFDGIILEIAEKKMEFDYKKRFIEILVLGSSHGSYGFNPLLFKSVAFNACSNSQDLYYSYQLYKVFSKQAVNLKKVYLFFSVFSNGYDIEKTSGNQICSFFNYFYGIPYKYGETKQLAKYFNACKIRDIKNKNKLKYKLHNNNGFNNNLTFYPGDSFEVNKRALTHLRENIRINSQIKNIIYLHNLCIQNNQELNIIISPARSDYKEYLPDEAFLFKKLFHIANEKKIKIINLYSSIEFNDEDFGDSDHLNRSGANKLTNIILNT